MATRFITMVCRYGPRIIFFSYATLCHTHMPVRRKKTLKTLPKHAFLTCIEDAWGPIYRCNPFASTKISSPFIFIRTTFKYPSYLCYQSWHAVDITAMKGLRVFVHGKLLVWFRNPFKPSEVNLSRDDTFIMLNATIQPGANWLICWDFVKS